MARPYDINVTVTIMPKLDNQGFNIDQGLLSFTRRFTVKGSRISDIARKIDAVQDAVALLAEEVPVDGD